MLSQVTLEELKQYWETFLEDIKVSLPEKWRSNDIILGNIYKALVNGIAHLWVYFDEDKKVTSVITTTIVKDRVSGIKNLLIYTIRNKVKASEDIWFDGFETLKDFAKINGCQGIVGYTKNKKVTDKVITLGGSMEAFIFMEV